MEGLHEISTLIEFDVILTEMKLRVDDMESKNSKPELIEQAKKRIERLIKIYKGFDQFYTSANFYGHKALKLEREKLDLQKVIAQQADEIKRLNAILEWQK